MVVSCLSVGSFAMTHLKRRQAANHIYNPSNLPLIREAINGGAIYLIYYIYQFIPYIEAQPTEAEKEIALGKPRQVKRKYHP